MMMTPEERLLSCNYKQNDKDIFIKLSEALGVDITDRKTCLHFKGHLSFDQITKVEKIIEWARHPASDDLVKGWLNTLWAITGKRRTLLEHKGLLFRRYVDHITEYPADIAHAVCHEPYTWFPDEKLIIERLDELYADRSNKINRAFRIIHRSKG